MRTVIGLGHWEADVRGFIVVGLLIIGCSIGVYYNLDSWVGVGFLMAGIWLTFLLTSRLLSQARLESSMSRLDVTQQNTSRESRVMQDQRPQLHNYN